jgi:predicted phage terminase large subunit-like protein
LTEKHQLLLKLIQEEIKKRQHFNWKRQARPEQRLPQGNWRTWLILAGRGFGKTRTGAETIRAWVQDQKYHRIGLISSSIEEARAVMVEGESGLLAVHPPQMRPIFQASKGQLRWSAGAIATLYGGDRPERLRGPQFDAVWIDELAKFRRPEELWQQVQLCLRLGQKPRCVITTTPRPLKLLQTLCQDPSVYVTRGSTFDNQANLAPTFLRQIQEQFSGTRLGAQELYAQILSEQPGALWNREMIRYQSIDQALLERIVIAIDPAVTHHIHSDETGIIVVGLTGDKKAYVIKDLSGRWSPHEWGQRIVQAYWQYKADRVVAEVNKGGDLVERVLRTLDSTVSFKEVRATRGKYTRAEPVAALYEQERVYHCTPHPELEDQLCHFVPGMTTKSPDRLDALVWAITELMLESEVRPQLKVWAID